jgi:glycosyltransferase involved in cell wall biosynthesis
MASGVNIVTSDRGWILETLARELATRLPYVTFGEGPDRAAAIQYYMTYSCRGRRLSPVEVAYFAHLEPDAPTRERFFRVAREVEHCVTHARLYEAVLREAGIGHVTTIPPGVDLESFALKLRIGVVGRAYHTGRKGEHLVAAVADIPEIEWAFTGDGFPEPALNLPPEAMPEFYRGLDYMLVPSLYEGGPMCVVEALACGTEVIAPPVGWVPDFPHIEFPAGDAEALRRVLLDLVAKKRAARAAVLDRGWEGWAAGHDKLFRDLARTHGVALDGPRAKAPRLPRRVGILLHGDEKLAQGGPSVRAPRLARELTENGIPAELRLHPDRRGLAGFDLIHVFNAWPAWSAPDAMRRSRAAGAAVVASPILLDHAFQDLWETRLPALFAAHGPGDALDAALAAFRAELADRRADGDPRPEPAPGFGAALREMAALADGIALLSEAERGRLDAYGARTDHARLVRNPVDVGLFAGADPGLFRAATGLTDFVLCPARLEPRKNQLILIQALRGTGLPVVLLGHAPHAAYRDTVEKHRFDGLHVMERLEANSPLLASAYAAARVVALPSWSEGAPLAALEAAAAGAAVVLAEGAAERECLGPFAHYADVADPAALKRAVMAAWETPREAGAIAAQRDFVAQRHAWDRHREATEVLYVEALEAARARGAGRARTPLPLAPVEARIVPLVMDVTTSARHRGRWTGIARVEAALAQALAAEPRAAMRFIAWDNETGLFHDVDAVALRDGRVVMQRPAQGLEAGAPLLVAGSAWMQNGLYAERLVGFARTHRLRLLPLIHDVIPALFPFWFEEGYAPVFLHNLALLLDAAEGLIAVSDSTRRDIESFAAGIAGLTIPDIAVIREGDEIGGAEDDPAPDLVARFAARPFVLCVGAVHARKNHRLLHDAWLRLVPRMGGRCPDLVLVGGVAWNGRDTARGLREDPRLEGRVTILDDVDDATLRWLYGACLFTVYPSVYEGWGLPVAESLRHGKACIAADIASIPEIAPGLVELLPPDDVARWAARVQFLANSRAARAAAEARIIAGYPGTAWAVTAEQVLHVAETLLPGRPARPYTAGAVVDMADRVPATRVRAAGWHPVERWGCWTSAGRAELVLEPAIPAGEAMVLVAEVRAIATPAQPFDARIEANGTDIGTWRFTTGAPQVLHAVIPTEVAAAATRLDIAIHNGNLMPAAPDDPRQVGLGVAKLALAPLSAVRDAGAWFGTPPPDGRRLAPGRTADLLAEGVSHAALQGDWVARAGWGMTPTAFPARLDLMLDTLPGRDLALTLRLRPVASAAAPLRIVARVGGTEIGAASFASDDPATMTLPIPAALRGLAQPLALDLVADPPRAPAGLGIGAAAEAFGFGLIALAAHLAGTAPVLDRLDLAPGETLRLAGGAPKPGADWHAPEPDATWTFGRTALLPLRLGPAAREGTVLTLAFEAFRATLLTVTAAGRVLAEVPLTPGMGQRVAFPVPPGLCAADGALDLLLAVDAAPSPFAAGTGDDERPLGLRVATVGAAKPAPRAVTLDFSAGGDLGALALAGFHPAEPEGRWSQAAGAEIRFARPAAAAARLWIGLEGRVFGTAITGPAVLQVGVPGEPPLGLVFEDDGFGRRRLAIPAASLPPPGGEVRLRLRRPGGISPAAAGEGGDRRELGFMVKRLTLTWE